MQRKLALKKRKRFDFISFVVYNKYVKLVRALGSFCDRYENLSQIFYNFCDKNSQR